ncbi:efflux RND transporter periplasmic adaptor subunit [Jiulongibacter sediminis]|jgi:membrane fusion protein (multidrug efflux system)|uniref:efflux RND transporter periplasmic adaptor subunit n=1 Tax=Jiulongibacter sediminis TaxID=1605367 RepID=UPI0026ED6306|nr:efflux RND transporter periplasmic adaptor subunit [Jiulongibacter sediminis]
MKPLIIIGSIIALLIVGKVFFWNSSDEGPQMGGASGSSGPMAVEVLPVQIDESDLIINSSGTLSPNEEVELRAELSGLLVGLNINEGSYVNKGQLIAKIKDDDLKAQLKRVKIEEELADQIEARQKKLLEIEAISKEEYEISVNNVRKLNADKELLQVQLAKTEVRAPFSGRIGLKYISEGAYVTPTTAIATLVQTNPLKIDFSIPEKYLSKVRVGQDVQFRIDGSEDVFDSKIVAISPKIDQTLRTLQIRGVTSNAVGKLLPGMFVNVDLVLGREESVSIPSETIIPVLEGKKVYVKKDGKVKEVMIETGLRDSKVVQVTEGLNPGDSLITSALMTLKEGMPVKANP